MKGMYLTSEVFIALALALGTTHPRDPVKVDGRRVIFRLRVAAATHASDGCHSNAQNNISMRTSKITPLALVSGEKTAAL